MNPNSAITTVITGRYVKQGTISANEAALSKARLEADLRSSKERHVKLEVKGKPSSGSRYRSTTDYVRADRTARGKIRVTPKGRDYLHTIETTPERELRVAKARRNSRLTIIGGRTLRYGVPVLMVGWTIFDLVDQADKRTKETAYMDLQSGRDAWALISLNFEVNNIVWNLTKDLFS